MAIWYATREEVKRALNAVTAGPTPDADERVDRAIASASEDVEGQMRRVFYPTDATHTFDWLDHQYSLIWRLWLDQLELAKTPTAVLSAGTDITSGVLARPDDGPPYDCLEIDLSTNSAWNAGATYQRQISVAGTFGYRYDTAPAGTLAANANSSVTTLTLSTSVGWGTGSLLIVGTERVLVTDRNLADTTATLSAGVDAQAKTTSLPLSDGTKVARGEVLTVGSERMLCTDVAGNTAIVIRGYDGSVLATHSSSDHVWAPRAATVTRGALGTSAAAHTAADAVSVFAYPGLVRQLTVAESVTNVLQEHAGYARSIGTDKALETLGKGLIDLRARCLNAHGRKVLVRTAGRFI